MTNAEKFKLMSAKQHAIRAKTMEIVESDPTVEIRLGGKDGMVYMLEYSYGPVSRIFKKTGVNVNLTAIGPQHIGDPEVFETLLREGLRVNCPNAYSDPNLMDEVRMKHLGYYTACIQLALAATEPDPEEIGRILDEIEGADNPQQELPLVIASSSAGSGDGASAGEYHPQT